MLAAMGGKQKIQRLITDEPQGVLVGFRLTEEEAEAADFGLDEWEIESDDGGEDSVPVWTEDGELKIRPEPSPEEMARGIVPLGPDLDVWRSREELNEWLKDMERPTV